MEEGGYYHGFLGRGARSLTHAHTLVPLMMRRIKRRRMMRRRMMRRRMKWEGGSIMGV